MGIPYVLLPHNIEFIVPGKSGEKGYGQEFDREVAAISGARKCLCISDYDAAVCETFNPNVEVIAYFPGPEDLRTFENIRSRRLTSTKRGCLTLGSAKNLPTRQGVIELVSTLRTRGYAKDELIVAGFGTESLREQIGSHAEVLGSLNDEQLRESLVGCKAVVLHQRQTSGFLTRLVEMNLCGIPVVVLGGYRQAKRLEAFGIFTDIGVLQESACQGPFEAFAPPIWSAES